jgi:hypothetical protein
VGGVSETLVCETGIPDVDNLARKPVRAVSKAVSFSMSTKSATAMGFEMLSPSGPTCVRPVMPYRIKPRKFVFSSRLFSVDAVDRTGILHKTARRRAYSPNYLVNEFSEVHLQAVADRAAPIPGDLITFNTKEGAGVVESAP